MPLEKDVLHPPSKEEKLKHKKKHLVQSPNLYFMHVKCLGCYKITTALAMYKRWFSVSDAPPYSVSLLKARPDLQKDVPSDGSSSND